jgi:hypothetical protein
MWKVYPGDGIRLDAYCDSHCLSTRLNLAARGELVSLTLPYMMQVDHKAEPAVLGS